MIQVPAERKARWDAAVKELQPFDVKLEVVSNGTTKIIDSGRIVDLFVTRTLYDKASIGNCASSQMELSYIPNTNLVGYWQPAYGDKVSIFISPKTIAGAWWCPQGVFYVSSVQLDSYTGVYTVSGVDALAFKSDIVYQTIYPAGQVAYRHEIVNRCLSLMGVSLSPTSSGYIHDGPHDEMNAVGYTCKELLSIIAGENGMNWSIGHNGTVKAIGFSLYDTDHMTLGRRAETITHDGTWDAFSVMLSRVEMRAHNSQGQPYSKSDWEKDSAQTSVGTSLLPLFGSSLFLVTGYAQDIINRIATYGGPYTAFTCANMVFDPALELGDQVTVLNKSDSPLLAHDNNDPLLWIEPGNDDTKIAIDQPHAYVPYWEQQQTEDGVTGPIGKLVVDYKTPQIAQLLQSPAPQG